MSVNTSRKRLLILLVIGFWIVLNALDTNKRHTVFDQRTIKRLIRSHTIISFDVFDTLLLRPYYHPTDLFRHLELLEMVPGYAEARISAELRARETTPGEITFDDIYDNIPPQYWNMKKRELEMELNILFVNPEMKVVFDYAKKMGKRIIILSDMYLSSATIEELLRRKGYDGFAKVYVSSDLKKRKESGSLYEEVLRRESVNPQRILHIGDNQKSDVEMAGRYGVSTVWYEKKISKLMRLNKRVSLFRSRHTDLPGSILLGLLTLADPGLSYWEYFGYVYAGPVILGFMKWLDSIASEDKCTDIFFVARDGYTLQKVFDMIKHSNITTHYVFAPRITSVVLNFDYTYTIGNGAQTILDYFHIKRNTKCKDPLKEVEFEKAVLEPLIKSEREQYRRYISGFSLSGQRIGIVDSISIQLSAQRAISKVLNLNTTGYYWYVRKNSYVKNYTVRTFQGDFRWLFQPYNWAVMELFMTAPTPPVERIKQSKVIFKAATKQERKRIRIYPSISRGALQFASTYNLLFGSTDVEFSPEMLTDWVNILCAIPTTTDKRYFRSVEHAVDTNHSNYTLLMKHWYRDGKK